ncbi:Chalcone isomerase-like [Marinobacter persicus]|uniref:Chalcone isomerase-like n=1 Tax=Marinobacter persicus TaxID=930118 RepID=A0A1I3Y4P5_9GAMM|nr:chalcone isomerase family protein [Marinobacter persicus]SFK26828.1 Chalcone isomerase-like [Marinobacter persicus]
MNKRLIGQLLAAFVLFGSLAGPAMGRTVGGVDVQESYQLAGESLALSGAGTRSKWFMDLYVGALYLPEVLTSGNAVLEADQPQAITLHITSGMITSERMTEATEEGFEASTGGDTAPYRDDIDRFMAVFSDEIKEGDSFELAYVPGEGVRVLKNGELKETVGDLAFKKVLFGIWLSDDPAQESLKDRMLGRD